MNSLSWLIYLAAAAGDLHFLIEVALFISVVGAGVVAFTAEMAYGDDAEVLTKRWKKMLFVAAPIFGLILVVLPSTKTIMFIAASEFSEQSENVQNISSKSYKALDKFLSDYLEEKE